MDIEFWDNKSNYALAGMIRSWQDLDTGSFNVKIVEPDANYINNLASFTGKKHNYTTELRSILQVNNKYIFLDSNDAPTLSAGSRKIPFDLIIKTQYNDAYRGDAYRRAKSPVVPFTYLMNNYNMELIDRYWKLRQEILRNRKFTSSMFWAGKVYKNPNSRQAVKDYLKTKKHAQYRNASYEAYLSQLATTQAGVSVTGMGDFCHRDMELMSVGSVFFRKTFVNEMRNPLIPNVHYYTIGGHEVGINRTLRHFGNYFEPNGEYRNFTLEEWNEYRDMSFNARKWWEDNCSPQGSFQLFVDILEENSIV